MTDQMAALKTGLVAATKLLTGKLEPTHDERLAAAEFLAAAGRAMLSRPDVFEAMSASLDELTGAA